MNKIIVVAGANGNLGKRICKYLIEKGATVKALVREDSDPTRYSELENLGVLINRVDYNDIEKLAGICIDAHCVVSALSGLNDVIIDTQSQLLNAAVSAGVKRFIPSDYSLDFTNFKAGENRNLDWRRKFHTYLDTQPIAATSIFNGAFMDMLTDQFPMIAFKKQRITYWGEASHEMGFTTMDDTASYTALVALDESSPRYLRISGQNVSAKEIAKMMSKISETPFQLMRLGGPNRLARLIKIIRFLAPQKTKTYPVWQGMQYMLNMTDQRARIRVLDNKRYPEINWTQIDTLLDTHYKTNYPKSSPQFL